MHLHKMPWLYLVFIYIYIASVAPVWVLLQPRDYLNSFLLLFMIGAAALGIIVANPTISLPVYTEFTVNGMSLFPFCSSPLPAAPFPASTVWFLRARHPSSLPANATCA